MMNPDLRASDADRRHFIDTLTAHTAAGRLTLDEFTARVDVVNRSRTYRQLAAVTADLPELGHSRPGRRVMLAVALPAVVLAGMLTVLLVAMAGWGQMSTMMASMTAAMGCG